MNLPQEAKEKDSLLVSIMQLGIFRVGFPSFQEVWGKGGGEILAWPKKRLAKFFIRSFTGADGSQTGTIEP